MLFRSLAVDNQIIYIGFTAFKVSHNMIDHSLKVCRCIFHTKRHNPKLIKDIWGAKGRNIFGVISKGDLTVKRSKFCIANFINANIYTRNRVRIRFGALIDFSNVCHKSKGPIWFWNQNTWETPFIFAWFNYVIL